MRPPFISYITFNRMGLTIRNLSRLLSSDEDFELHIVDCNSLDDTWKYLQGLTDARIKSKTRFNENLGPIYALNYNLYKRQPEQYFFTIDSDVYIKTKNWIACFMAVFNAFPEVGLLGVARDKPYTKYIPPCIPRTNGNASYLEIKNGTIGETMDFVPGHLQCLRPELIREVGYWSEENGYGDAELTPRVVNHTAFKAGFLTTVKIDMTQSIGCIECAGRDLCKRSKSAVSCFSLSRNLNVNKAFSRKFRWKYLNTFKELAEGKRTAYCASVHDAESQTKCFYNAAWAEENFEYYRKKSNSDR